MKLLRAFSLINLRREKTGKPHDLFTIGRKFHLIYQNKKEEMLSYFNNCREENKYSPVGKSI
jgi:hypothetical protein